MEEKTLTMKMVPVTNRDNGEVVVVLSNDKLIHFNAGETRKISLEDLAEMRSGEGNRVLLKDYLMIKDQQALDYLEIETEPEYFYTKEEIRVLLETGTLEQLEDCLNFAPEGVLDILKDVALSIELPDTRKRKLISQKTGYDIDNIIRVRQFLNTEGSMEGEDKEVNRKNDSTVPQRKAVPILTVEEKKKFPEYKVISKEK